jgi:tRNA pseudouridine55 synthase
VVNKLRGVLRWKSVGHAGTLDPDADGVLIVLCGNATKRTTEFMDLGKEYRARIRFGITTSTDDLAGMVLSETAISDWNDDRIRSALLQFEGDIEQIPPAVSAIKVQGKRSYARARAGETFELAARSVHISRIRFLRGDQPDIDIDIACSRGTYIRSIARDLGGQLGWGGTLATLTRTAVGPFRVENALNLADILRHKNEFASG